jgi:hypothetical protein
LRCSLRERSNRRDEHEQRRSRCEADVRTHPATPVNVHCDSHTRGL